MSKKHSQNFEPLAKSSTLKKLIVFAAVIILLASQHHDVKQFTSLPSTSYDEVIDCTDCMCT